MSCKKCILWARDIKSMFLFYFLLYQLPFFEFLFSVINHYHINGLHLFWDSFKWFCLQISSDTKYLFFSCPRHCDQRLIVVIVYYFQIWYKKEHIIISSVISSHMGSIYIETPYISSHIGPIYTEIPILLLLLIESLAVTWAPCILTHPIHVIFTFRIKHILKHYYFKNCLRFYVNIFLIFMFGYIWVFFFIGLLKKVFKHFH